MRCGDRSMSSLPLASPSRRKLAQSQNDPRSLSNHSQGARFRKGDPDWLSNSIRCLCAHRLGTP
eukprot:18706-Chlamydomonas_euryale.AAC.3